MQKNGSDRKKNKAKIKSKADIHQETITKRINPVSDDAALVTAVMTKTPFTLDPKYTTMTLPNSPDVELAPIMEALWGNTTVKEIIITQIRNTRDLRGIVRCLASANRGIRKIVLQSHYFEPDFSEALTKILKLNRRIKTLEISRPTLPPAIRGEDGFKRFCDGMEYYNFEELIVAGLSLGDVQNKLLLDSLRYNQSIKVLSLTETNLYGGPWTALCNTLLSNPTITDLTFRHQGGRLTADCFAAFKRVLGTNNLRRLSFSGFDFDTDILKILEKELKESTSITDLTFQHCKMDWELFGNIFSTNKSIKKLDIMGTTIKAAQLQFFNFGSNTTLKELNVLNCYELDSYDALFYQLKDNHTLKVLNIGKSIQDINNEMLERFVASRKGLAELNWPHNFYMIHSDTLIALANGLKVNKSLRKISMCILSIDCEAFILFRNAIMLHNRTLQELHMTKISDIFLQKPPVGATWKTDNMILDLLKTNKSLRYITGAEEYPHLEEILKSNRDAQDKIVREICTFIKMIVIKPREFILPVEVWFNIFKYVTLAYGAFDFEEWFEQFRK